MKVVFADTGYWIALLNPDDRLHVKVKALLESLNAVHLVTSEAVLLKVFNYFYEWEENFQEAASKLTESLYDDPYVTIVSQTSPLFQEGVLLQRQSQAWSLTECVSFRIMQTMGITEALTDNNKFEQAGFVALLKD